MAQRAIALKPLYGTAFMMQLDGSVWLIYDNAKEGSTDADILEWMRDSAMIHQAYVEANALGEAAKNIPKTIEIEGDGIAAQLVAAPPQPAQAPAPPPQKLVPTPKPIQQVLQTPVGKPIQKHTPQIQPVPARLAHAVPQGVATQPARRVHDYGGPYRIGATCKACGMQATGLEVKDCAGKPAVNHNDSTPSEG